MRRPVIRQSLIAASVTLGAGCGTAAASTPDESDSTVVPTSVDPGEPLCPEFSPPAGLVADVTTTSTAGPPPESVMAPPLMESQRLEPMLGIVHEYGSKHGDSFAGYGLTWHDTGDASVFVAFKNDVTEHREALLAMVPFPDELVVCRAPMTSGELQALQDELYELYPDQITESGHRGVGRLDVTLLSSEEQLAGQLLDEYGDNLMLSVGLFPYPMPDPWPAGNCQEVPSESAPADVEAVIERTDQLAGGGEPPHPAANLALRNTGDEPVHLEYGALAGFLVRPGESTAVSVYEFAVPAMLYSIDIPPGDTHEEVAGIGLASCDPALGYRVPAGDYELVVVIDSVVSERLPVTVTDERQPS